MKLGKTFYSVFSILVYSFILSNFSNAQITTPDSTSSITIEGIAHKMKDVSILIGTVVTESDLSDLESGKYVRVTNPQDIRNKTIYQDRLYRVFQFIEPVTVIPGIKGKTVRLTLERDGRNYVVAHMEVL